MEKPSTLHGMRSAPTTILHVVQSQPWDENATKKLVRKIDWHILPFMSFICLLCFLDRTNIGNARLDNLEGDLGLHDLQYNDCLAVLFPFYIIAEIPSNMMMKRVRPSNWLTFIIFAWSACTIAQGFVRNYTGLMITRVFLGLFEGGWFPSANYFFTQWYCKEEVGLRMALFFSAPVLAGAFGGILARGIAEMRGVGGLPGWAWIFILEGLLTMVVSVIAFWGICNYPSTAGFLTPSERDEVQRRLRADSSGLTEEYDIKYVWQALVDWRVYIFMLICMAGFCPIYSFSMFLPTIVKSMGYTANDAQLMSVPPYVFACIFTIAGSWIADRKKQRAIFMLAFQGVALAGLALLASSGHSTLQYTGVVLAAIGIYPQIPLGLAWNSSNVGGSLKRGTAIAMQIMGGNCGGIIASYVYIARDGPRYITGHSILIGFVGMAFLLTLFMLNWCKKENARRDKLALANSFKDLVEEELSQGRGLGNDAPWFRYST